MAGAEAGVERRFGQGQRIDQIDVELGQIVANGLGAMLVRWKKARFLQQIAAEGKVTLGKLLVQCLVGQQPEPDEGDQAIPERTGAQCERLVERSGALAAPNMV